ncbi:hypothetical protein AU467_01940 [Mesorhizobium loti]|uniref:Uncharacterized protein n=1 Tax=Rhizobium loti TaxID=381 RepID=A0A117N3X2_RHILI|nr:hypothetical protein AU467_01940 [Mesorhizobium loti]
MFQDNAAVSVVVPASNAEQTIDATLARIRRQTHQALDMVVDVPGDRSRWQEIANYGSGRLFYLRTMRG